MKYVVAVIQSHELEDVRDARLGLGIDALTVVEVRRYGSHEEHREIYRADEYQVGFLPRTKIEFAVSDEHVQRAMGAIREAALTGEIGDGRIYVLELAHAVQTRSGKIDADVAAL
jgi:nitrogen regulatory protein P-II 2